MTKEECIKILAMLGAFYGGGKTDPKAQVGAWYSILHKYPFDVAERAVLTFAENDVRDYATFPAVGKIVQAMRDEQNQKIRAINGVIESISYGRDYDTLSQDSKMLISKDLYESWSDVDAEEFSQKAGACKEILLQNQLRIGGEVSE